MRPPSFITKLFLGIVVSCFFYSFGFTFLPESINTKMLLAVVGVVLYFLQCVRTGNIEIHKDVLGAIMFSVIFSLSCYFSATVNVTGDMSYATYFVSFFVWFFAAYAVCSLLRMSYGSVDIPLVTVYLAWVAVVQCVLAQVIDNVPELQTFVDRFIEQGSDFLHRVHRIYGIGCSLDPAGVRLAITLIMVSYLIVEKVHDSDIRGNLWGLFVSFIVITVLGCMISRTTMMGSLLGVLYLLVFALRNTGPRLDRRFIAASGIFLLILVVGVLLCIYLYNTDSAMRKEFRFAFEGFFNWAETGVWSTSSTDKLNSEMWVWPDNPRDWFIGTGLFGNWIYNTDIGYCRFILYCGLLGFSIFALFFVYLSVAFAGKFPGTGLVSLMLLALAFIVWVKVSSDIFLIFALFLCADAPLPKEEVLT